MRTIKFRGKRLDNGKWVYGDLQHRAGGQCAIVVPEPDGNGVWDYAAHFVDPNTVGQCTGVFDYEGRAVYDGDIVESITASEFKAKENIPWEWEDGEYAIDRYIVMWDKFYNDFGFTFLGDEDNRNWLNLKYFRVIGNIHDNPELLNNN